MRYNYNIQKNSSDEARHNCRQTNSLYSSECSVEAIIIYLAIMMKLLKFVCSMVIDL